MHKLYFNSPDIYAGEKENTFRLRALAQNAQFLAKAGFGLYLKSTTWRSWQL